jgi:hypothetical protein
VTKVITIYEFDEEDVKVIICTSISLTYGIQVLPSDLVFDIENSKLNGYYEEMYESAKIKSVKVTI